jgi:hypothetical protein
MLHRSTSVGRALFEEQPPLGWSDGHGDTAEIADEAINFSPPCQRSSIGADDYITRPFGMNELLARMRAAARY